ncbi:MAG TPA: fatty acyl-AMP ligase, partial [Thermoanaerobaculia bacterium]|nr:fatty acyl-AMP ligase [Thermoanaerobaculia bacterium]
MRRRPPHNRDTIVREGYPCLQPTICDAIREFAIHCGSRTALTFLDASGAVNIAIDYAQLDRRARACAATFRQQFRAGDRLILALPRGLELIEAFFGALYAGIVPVPLEHKRFLANGERMQAMLAETAAAGLVMAEPARSAEVTIVLPEAWRETDPADWADEPVDPQSLAFLQYTSGSISRPRGVMVGHDNLAANGLMIRRAFGLTAESTVVTWLPLFHDMGLIGTLIQPLWAGAHAVLLSPAAFLQKPLRWLEAISSFRATISGAPDFAYDLCVRHVTAGEAAALDLSSWRVAFNGAEPVRAATLDGFAKHFAPAKFERRAFFPCYGLAEATLFVSGARAAVDETQGRPLVSAGDPAPELELAVVNADLQPVAANEVGEILVAGPSVARGYWNRPHETAETFAVHTAGGRGPFLRTGDLGYVSSTGQLVVTGRVKELLIVRGVNHYPHDLEATAA